FKLNGIPQIDRPSEIIRRIHQPEQRVDEVIDVAKGTRLLTLAVNGDGLAPQGLDDEIRYDSAIVRVHSRTISVENPGHLDSQLMLAVIIEKQRFCAALSFVVA